MNKDDLEKLMNTAIYHPSFKVRKRNEVRFYKECLNVKSDKDLAHIIHLFHEKRFIHNKNHSNCRCMSTYIYTQRKPYDLLTRGKYMLLYRRLNNYLILKHLKTKKDDE